MVTAGVRAESKQCAGAWHHGVSLAVPSVGDASFKQHIDVCHYCKVQTETPNKA